ncbi:hypothetical protein V1294_006293 [Bradyrhizobium sp. AZCC 1678]|uniref:Uncharacterized protein n=1 Tax=Bradyrhizobium algeriense TaxID=634784 RepID=A0ABU8B714_9BRAD
MLRTYQPDALLFCLRIISQAGLCFFQARFSNGTRLPRSAKTPNGQRCGHQSYATPSNTRQSDDISKGLLDEIKQDDQGITLPNEYRLLDASFLVGISGPSSTNTSKSNTAPSDAILIESIKPGSQ